VAASSRLDGEFIGFVSGELLMTLEKSLKYLLWIEDEIRH